MNGLYDELRIALHAIWVRRWVALAVAWAIAILGWLAVSQMPNRYESRARVLVQFSSILPDGTASPTDQQQQLDTIRQTLVSGVNLEKVVRGTDLANTVATQQDVNDRVAALQGAIKVEPQQNNLFQITASAASPKLAQQIVAKLINIFVDQNLSDDRNDTQAKLKFLDGQVEQLQTRLQEADAKRSAFETQYMGALPGTGSTQDRIAAARAQVAQVDSDLAAAQTSLAAINGQMAGTQSTMAGAGGVAGVAGPARARLAAILGQLADAKAKGYTDQHPDVIALKAQLAQAQAAAAKEPLLGGAAAAAQANPVFASLRSMQADKQAQVAALSARKQQLQRDLDTINTKLSSDPGFAAEQGQIDRDYQVMKDQYDKLLSDRENLRIQAQAQAQSDSIKFQVIGPPSASRTPAAPNRLLLLTGVLIVALGGGVGAAFGMAQLRTTYPTAQKLEAATGLPVIGSIGEMVSDADRALRKRKLRLFVAGAAGIAVAYVGLLGVEMVTRGLTA